MVPVAQNQSFQMLVRTLPGEVFFKVQADGAAEQGGFIQYHQTHFVCQVVVHPRPGLCMWTDGIASEVLYHLIPRIRKTPRTDIGTEGMLNISEALYLLAVQLNLIAHQLELAPAEAGGFTVVRLLLVAEA